MLRKTPRRRGGHKCNNVASMRPQRNAAENRTQTTGEAAMATEASMRPQRNAAENIRRSLVRWTGLPSFNEAAA